MNWGLGTRLQVVWEPVVVHEIRDKTLYWGGGGGGGGGGCSLTHRPRGNKAGGEGFSGKRVAFIDKIFLIENRV